MKLSDDSSLPAEVARFRDWANTQPKIGPEWECNYDGHAWSALLTAAQHTLATGTWVNHVDDLLFVLARDNEGEVLREDLLARPDILRELAPAIVDRGEPEARWQLAQTLGDLAADWGVALLSRLAADEDEYVRRRSLLAMSSMNHPDTERVARAAWETGEEYPRLAALHVLLALGVADAEDLLLEAERSPHAHLVAAAVRLR